ncbi:MAG: DUF1697 domain-containing protein [Propionibacteriales bacterium]|nr:DUF1697 domain-containing protein [Propionibacteriales bacterium]
MTTYVALLRGINVGGHNKIGMADLRSMFDTLGYAGARTYLQSGNVVFDAPATDPARLAGAIEAGIAGDFGLSITVLLRTREDLDRVVANSPFVEREADPKKLHVAFLSGVPADERVSAFESPAGENVGFVFDGAEIHLHYPHGYGRTKLTHAYLEKRLGVAATARNWRTVFQLLELASK